MKFPFLKAAFALIAAVMLSGCTHFLDMPAARPTRQYLPTAPSKTICLKGITDSRPMTTQYSHEYGFCRMSPHKFIIRTTTSSEELMTDLLREGFARCGYNLVTDNRVADTVSAQFTAFPGLYNVDAAWSWSLQADINCYLTMTIDGKPYSLSVSSHGKNVCQRLSEPNVSLAVTRTYDDFLSNFVSEMKGQGL